MGKEHILSRSLGLFCVFLAYILLTFLGDILKNLHAASAVIDNYSSYRLGIWYGVTALSALYIISAFRLSVPKTVVASIVIFCIVVFGLDRIHSILIPQPDPVPGNKELSEMLMSAAYGMVLFLYGVPYLIIWLLSYWIARSVGWLKR
jgi:hypothetical protein